MTDIDHTLQALGLTHWNLESTVRNLREFKQRVEDDLNKAGVGFGMIAATVERLELRVRRAEAEAVKGWDEAAGLAAEIISVGAEPGKLAEHIAELEQRPNVHHLVLEAVDEEMQRNLARWGQQDHPSYPPDSNSAHFRFDRRRAQAWKDRNAERVAEGTLAWDGILLEEVHEALAETDPVARRAELIQVAAVAAQEVEAIDRRLAASEESAA